MKNEHIKFPQDDKSALHTVGMSESETMTNDTDKILIGVREQEERVLFMNRKLGDICAKLYGDYPTEAGECTALRASTGAIDDIGFALKDLSAALSALGENIDRLTAL